jgi:hypothetical protein
MAFYVFHPTVAASTTTTQQEQIVGGTITRISAMFPNGCNGLVHVKVSINDVQIIPRNPLIMCSAMEKQCLLTVTLRWQAIAS